MKKITVYTVTGCPFCEQIKKLLKGLGVEFSEIEARPNTEAWNEMVKITGSSAVPQVVVDGESLGGYLDLLFLEASGVLYEKLGIKGRTEEHHEVYDVAILGAGPAGLSAAIYTARKMMKTIVISKNIGGQVTWTYDIENYPGFSQINAQELIYKFKDHVEKYGVHLELGKEAVSAEIAGRVKRIDLEDGRSFYSKTVIIATGSRHRPLDIPGEQKLAGRGLSYCSTCDAPLYASATVAVIGGGNSALEAILDLAPITKKLYLISLTPLTGDALLQSKIKALKPPVEILTKYRPVEILGDSEVQGLVIESLDGGGRRKLDVEGIFVEIGLLPNSSLFVDVLATNDRGEIIIDELCRTGVAGVFACGDVTNVPYKQIVVAAGEGAKAALSAYYYLLNRR